MLRAPSTDPAFRSDDGPPGADPVRRDDLPHGPDRVDSAAPGSDCRTGSSEAEAEARRLEALHAYGILDSAPDARFQRLVQLAMQRIDIPMAAISLIDQDRQWFLARGGLSASQTPREQAFCAHTMRGDEVMVVQDATADARFAANPLVTGDPGIRFYAGAPLKAANGHALGAFCVIDQVARELSPDDLELLRTLAAVVVDMLELRRERAERERQAVALEQALADAREARARAEAAARTRTEFLAHLSHELRTPLNGVLGAAQLLARTPLQANQQRIVEVVAASGDALHYVIDQVLDWSRLEHGGIEVERIAFDAVELAGRCVAMLAAIAARKGVPVRLCAPAAPALPLQGDAARVRQVMLNLLNNAIKFTQAGGTVSLDVRERRARDGRRRVRMTVADTGIGLSREGRERLFGDFAQADPSISRRFGGTGLGLAISRRLAQAMGGVIGVSSRPGRGARFWLELRFEDEPQAVERAWCLRRPAGEVVGEAVDEAKSDGAGPSLRHIA